MKAEQVHYHIRWFIKETKQCFSEELSWSDEIQQTNSGGEDQDLKMTVTALRFGTSLNRCEVGCLGIDLQVSRGTDIALIPSDVGFK